MKQKGSFLILILIIFSCARVGNPTGGEKDTTPPKIIKTIPKNESIEFNKKEIKIYFDEFIQLKDLQKNLLFSPPQKIQPEISPMGTASKEIRIKFKDSLLPNTTYVINFGQSIVDFNEGNKMGNYQFVFSTGKQIDSLRLNGKVNALHFQKTPENIIVGLYPEDMYFDSIVYRKPPFYISKTDKKGKFHFTHLKEGKYKAIAIADEVGNFLYNPAKEAIGVVGKIITVPKDSTFSINLYKEKQKFNLDKFEQVTYNHILAQYKGSIDSLKINFLSAVSDSLYIVTPTKTDIWYKSNSDSVQVQLRAGKYNKILKGKRKEKKDSLIVNILSSNPFHPLDSLILSGNIPLTQVKQKNISFTRDSVPEKFEIRKTKKSEFLIDFHKTPGSTYQIILYPEAITDFLGNKNTDTIQGVFSIPKIEKYGNLQLEIPDVNQYYFVELLNNNKKIMRKSKTTNEKNIRFNYLQPGKYYLRIIFDPNKNNQWDTGNYLKHIQPENIIEIKKPIEIRANWDVNQKIKI